MVWTNPRNPVAARGVVRPSFSARITPTCVGRGSGLGPRLEVSATALAPSEDGAQVQHGYSQDGRRAYFALSVSRSPLSLLSFCLSLSLPHTHSLFLFLAPSVEEAGEDGAQVRNSYSQDGRRAYSALTVSLSARSLLFMSLPVSLTDTHT